MKPNVFIFHGTEGFPGENWFPWLKTELEKQGYSVTVPQFPSPPIIPAKVDDWFSVLDKYADKFDNNTIIVGHSLGGLFTLRVLEMLEKPIRAAFSVGTPVGVKPIKFYDRDEAFSGFTFSWDAIRRSADHFAVYQSDDDPYVSLGNGEALAAQLGVDMTFIPKAGHFNTAAGYSEFPRIRDDILGKDQD